MFSLLHALIFYTIGITLLIAIYFSGIDAHNSYDMSFKVIPTIIGVSFTYSGAHSLIGAFKSRYKVLKYQEICSVKTIQNYIRVNKDCYKHNQISCNQCGSKSIHFLKFYGAEENIPFSKYKAAIYNRHFCKQCSNTLFYTTITY